jgi:hypothetical protein
MPIGRLVYNEIAEGYILRISFTAGVPKQTCSFFQLYHQRPMKFELRTVMARDILVGVSNLDKVTLHLCDLVRINGQCGSREFFYHMEEVNHSMIFLSKG